MQICGNYAVPVPLAAQLRAFVASGGLLVAEAPLAARDRWGRELPDAPGFGLADVLGIRQVRPQPIEGGSITTSDSVFASQYRTQFQLAGARVAGTFADKTPAVTMHRFGKGTGIYVAAEVGRPNGSPPASGLQTFLTAALTQYAGLRPPARHAGLGFPGRVRYAARRAGVRLSACAARWRARAVIGARLDYSQNSLSQTHVDSVPVDVFAAASR